MNSDPACKQAAGHTTEECRFCGKRVTSLRVCVCECVRVCVCVCVCLGCYQVLPTLHVGVYSKCVFGSDLVVCVIVL